ncbi:hypothetical protein [Methanogenium cariaci]|uniref:hypothetical protein n=1 Tax=Methanogenium cariaci TaxID=2197 RepID=UPI000782CB1A|nr:hypothetical protein [Methanogenium cariaci]
MSLVDDESGISSKQVMNILIHSTNGEIVTQSEQKYHDASDRPPLQIIPIIQNLHSGEINENDSDILSYSAENVVDSLHKTVSESYTDLIFVKSEWNDAEIELSQIDSEIKKSKASIQKIMNQYGIVSSPVSAVIATLENEKSCVKSELNSNEQITKQRRNDLIHQIDGQKTEIKRSGTNL